MASTWPDTFNEAPDGTRTVFTLVSGLTPINEQTVIGGSIRYRSSNGNPDTYTVAASQFTFVSAPAPGETMLCFFTPQGVIPQAGAGGAMSLLSLRTLVRQESDTENDNHVADAELTSYINQSRYRLYDILITEFGEDYYTAKASFTTDGTNQAYALPDGTLYSGAPAFYKGMLLELTAGAGVAPNAPITLRKFNLREKNRFNRPLSIIAAPAIYPRYRIVGSNIEFNILPVAGLTCREWYAPRLSPLVNDGDVADDWSGWLEYVILDAALKAVQKQERDPSLIAARLQKIEGDIRAAAANRDLGEPNTVAETEDEGPYGISPMGSWGGGFW